MKWTYWFFEQASCQGHVHLFSAAGSWSRRVTTSRLGETVRETVHTEEKIERPTTVYTEEKIERRIIWYQVGCLPRSQPSICGEVQGLADYLGQYARDYGDQSLETDPHVGSAQMCWAD